MLANNYTAIGILNVKRVGPVELLYPGKVSNRGTCSRDQRVWRKPRATRACYCPKGEKHSCKLDSGLRELQIRQRCHTMGARHTSPSFLATHLLRTSIRRVASNRATSLPRQDVQDRQRCSMLTWWTSQYLVPGSHSLQHHVAAAGHAVVLAGTATNLAVQLTCVDINGTGR